MQRFVMVFLPVLMVVFSCETAKKEGKRAVEGLNEARKEATKPIRESINEVTKELEDEYDAAKDSVKKALEEQLNTARQKLKEAVDPSPQERFKKLTQLEVKDSLELLKFENDYLLLEGHYWAVFATTPNQIEHFLAQAAPWESEKWQEGPPPYNIRSHAVPYLSERFADDVALDEELLGAAQTYKGMYHACARIRCPDEDNPCENGNLLIVNTQNNQVYFKYWDY